MRLGFTVDLHNPSVYFWFLGVEEAPLPHCTVWKYRQQQLRAAAPSRYALQANEPSPRPHTLIPSLLVRRLAVTAIMLSIVYFALSLPSDLAPQNKGQTRFEQKVGARIRTLDRKSYKAHCAFGPFAHRATAE